MSLANCGGSTPVPLRPDQRPVPIGRGVAYRLKALSPAVARHALVGALACAAGRGEPTSAVHLELFARRLVLPIPAGIGIAPPQRRRGAYVLSGRCVYPIRTYEPTGVVRVGPQRAHLALGDLFAVWGQPLSRSALAGFAGRVTAFVAGRRWAGDPRSIPLAPHAEIVLEVGGYVAPHPQYGFPPGV